MTDPKEKREKAAIKWAVYYRNYRRVRDRALVRLAHKYPDEYKQILELEMQADEQQGKKWTDLSGNTDVPPDLNTKLRGASKAAPFATFRNEGENKGNNGGEA
jgi:hypothetical protein